MEVNSALGAFAALSQETRLWAFRVLVQAGPAGLSAGDVADALGSRQNTMSSHLKLLNSAGLITSRRDGRQVIYSANYDTVKSLVFFLMDDCCAGNAGVCHSSAAAVESNAGVPGGS
ncbi:MAG: transcriptional regulator [Gammaproteobacteria bacterium]|nr:MAG: transcriptional regulator [Gammaproteobacteria bacterium]RLA29980.1 MAG: transcriptional regulator [Gammaproteobacteria bacterium]